MSRLKRETNPPAWGEREIPLQHEKENGDFELTGENDPLPTKLFATDEVTGDLIKLSATKDEQGNYHLTTVEKAPAAYDEDKDVIKTGASINVESLAVSEVGGTWSEGSAGDYTALERGLRKEYKKLIISINTSYSGSSDVFSARINYYSPGNERIHASKDLLSYKGVGGHASLMIDIEYPDYEIILRNESAGEVTFRRFGIAGVR